MSHEAAVLIGLGQSGMHIEAPFDPRLAGPKAPAGEPSRRHGAAFVGTTGTSEGPAWDSYAPRSNTDRWTRGAGHVHLAEC